MESVTRDSSAIATGAWQRIEERFVRDPRGESGPRARRRSVKEGADSDHTLPSRYACRRESAPASKIAPGDLVKPSTLKVMNAVL
jgi:hypothetical protein